MRVERGTRGNKSRTTANGSWCGPFVLGEKSCCLRGDSTFSGCTSPSCVFVREQVPGPRDICNFINTNTPRKQEMTLFRWDPLCPREPQSLRCSLRIERTPGRSSFFPLSVVLKYREWRAFIPGLASTCLSLNFIFHSSRSSPSTGLVDHRFHSRPFAQHKSGSVHTRLSLYVHVNRIA